MGMNLVRLPFRWERLQPTLNAALNAAELARIKTFVDGTTSQGVSAAIGAERLAAFTAWLRTHGHRALLGEIGGASNDVCNQALDQTLKHLEANADVWAGWAVVG